MIKRLIKPGLRLLLLKLYILLAIIVVAYAWLASAPRSIPFISDHITQSLSSLSDQLDVTVTDTILKWDGVKEGMNIYLMGVSIDYDGQKMLYLPSINAELNLFKLLGGVISFKSLAIENAALQVSLMPSEVDTDSTYSDNQTPERISNKAIAFNAYQAALLELITAMNENSGQLPLHDIYVKDTIITALTRTGAHRINVPNFHARLINIGDLIMLRMESQIMFAQQQLNITSDGFLEADNYVRFNTQFDGLKPSLLSQFDPQFSWLADMPLQHHGTAELLLNPDGRIHTVAFDIGSLREAHQTHDTTLTLKGQLELYTYDEVGDNEAANDEASNDETKESAFLPDLTLTLDARNIEASHLQHYWPPRVSPLSRAWLMERVLDGRYRHIDMDVHFQPEFFLHKKLADGSTDMTISLEDVDLYYHPDLPVLENITTDIIIQDRQLHSTIQNSKVGNTTLPNLRIQVENLGLENTNLLVEGTVDGWFYDITHYFVPALEDPWLSCILPNIDGSISGSFAVDIMVHHSEDPSIDVDAVMNTPILTDGARCQAEQPYGTISSDASIHLPTISGKVRRLGSHHNEVTSSTEGQPVTVALQTVVTPQELALLGIQLEDIPLVDSINGVLGLDFSIEALDHKMRYEGKIDLQDATIEAPAMGINKAMDAAASFTFRIEDDSERYHIETLHFADDNNRINAAGVIHHDAAQYNVTIAPITLGQTHASLALSKQDDQPHMAVLQGENIDMRPILTYLNQLKERGSKHFYPEFPLDIGWDIEHLWMANDIMLHSVAGSLTCSNMRCQAGHFSGNFDKGSIAFEMKNNVNSSNDVTMSKGFLSLRTDNPEAFVKALDISQKLKGGELLTITADLDSKGHMHNGRITMKEFALIDTPFLAKLLSVLSISGPLKLLTGQGLGFDELDGEFSLNTTKNQLSLHKFKTVSNALGITADGEINLRDHTLKIQGAVIPAYMINSLLGNIPLIGWLFVAKEDEGVFASRYSAKGPISDATISINPFSMFTPGILRKVWGD